MDDLMSLRSEKHKDSEEETDQRPRADPLEKLLIVESWTCYVAYGEARNDGRS